MGKGGGGGYSTKSMEEATKKSLELQKQIYDQTRQDVQPWYQAGVGGVNRLADLLGVSGGTVQNRQQIYNELLPQYTTQQTSAGNPYLIDPTGRVIDESRIAQMYPSGGTLKDQALINLERLKSGDYEGIKRDNYQIMNQPTTTSQVDYDALNKAVSDRLGSQSLPSDYGSLLDRFDLSKFQQDPGYQFQLEQGQKALERKMSASGDTFSPRAAKALAEYNQGMANQEYQNAYNRYVNDQSNTYNMLAGISGMGQTSTGQMAGAGQNYANSATQLNASLANAQTAAQQAAASRPSMFGNLLGLGATALGGYFGGGGTLAGLGSGLFGRG